jgi:hypothetical protein
MQVAGKVLHKAYYLSSTCLDKKIAIYAEWIAADTYIFE